MDHRLDVLAGNRLARLLYGRPMPGLNTARHIFLEEAERGLYADWEKCTLDVVGHLRLAAGKYPEDPRLASLIGELAMGSERFRRLWARADVRARTHGRKAYRHPAGRTAGTAPGELRAAGRIRHGAAGAVRGSPAAPPRTGCACSPGSMTANLVARCPVGGRVPPPR